MQQPQDAALRKRTQIAKANRTMFVWIAGASALVGFAVVVAIFLGQKVIFNERVLAAKGKTVATLQADIAQVPQLEDQVRVLNTNSALSSIKVASDEQPVQVILDALPSDANSSALGASLQNVLLAGIGGLSISSLQVTPVAGVEDLSSNSSTTTTSDITSSTDQNAISFHAVLLGSQANFQQALQNIEKSIRIIDITRLEITSSGSQLTMTIDGNGFYEPATTLQLQKEPIKP